MNLFFYLQAFILNYSFIVIQAIIFFVLCFIKTQHFVKRKHVKTEKKYRNDRVPFQAGFTVLGFLDIPKFGTICQRASLSDSVSYTETDLDQKSLKENGRIASQLMMMMAAF